MSGAAACKPEKCWTTMSQRQNYTSAQANAKEEFCQKLCLESVRQALIQVHSLNAWQGQPSYHRSTGNTFHRWPMPGCLLLQVVHERVPSEETTLMAL